MVVTLSGYGIVDIADSQAFHSALPNKWYFLDGVDNLCKRYI